jgi:hypothetical protein
LGSSEIAHWRTTLIDGLRPCSDSERTFRQIVLDSSARVRRQQSFAHHGGRSQNWKRPKWGRPAASRSPQARTPFVGVLVNETVDRLIFFRCLCGEATDRSSATCTCPAERSDLVESGHRTPMASSWAFSEPRGRTQSQRLAFFGKPGRCTRTTQKRCPVGARITTHRSNRLTTLAPSFSSLATSAGMSSHSISIWTRLSCSTR